MSWSAGDEGRPVTEAVAVYLEVAPKRSFAGAIEWPGWTRGSRTPDEALARLAEYGTRYARVVAETVGGFRPPADASGFVVNERLAGGAGTDFGAPSAFPTADCRPVDEAELDRLTTILRACWSTFDRTADAAVGITLRTGPRGGGRHLEKIVGHAAESEEAYLNALGARAPKTPGADVAGRWAVVRAAIVDALAARVHGESPANPSNTQKPWTPRFFVRRSAWHLLDHAWEIEDRSTPEA